MDLVFLNGVFSLDYLLIGPCWHRRADCEPGIVPHTSHEPSGVFRLAEQLDHVIVVRPSFDDEEEPRHRGWAGEEQHDYETEQDGRNDKTQPFRSPEHHGSLPARRWAESTEVRTGRSLSLPCGLG